MMVREKSKRGDGIKILCLDVDGTLTDGKIYMGNEGELFKAFHVKDGCGIHDILIPYGIRPIIITGRMSSILVRRCAELGIKELFQGVEDKEIQLDKILKNEGIDYSKVAYMGDDINDFTCMRKIKERMGVIGCPADASKKIIEIADFVSIHKGGDGAVREFIDWIVEWEKY
jgi:3-deoxy-D-manno-octulosonate 8-phosphate phosphatase (KDO 8-P phosphatase)